MINQQVALNIYTFLTDPFYAESFGVELTPQLRLLLLERSKGMAVWATAKAGLIKAGPGTKTREADAQASLNAERTRLQQTLAEETKNGTKA